MWKIYVFFFFLITTILISCNKEDPSILPDKPIEWDLEYLGKPMGDVALNSITIHPEDSNLWFITSFVHGLIVTRDGGKNWENDFQGDYIPVLEIDPIMTNTIYLGLGENLLQSIDYGQSWTQINSFPKQIVSLLASTLDKTIYTGIRWEDSESENGIFKSEDMGKTWTLYSFNLNVKGLILWDIKEDKQNQKIYVATEIYDHPLPYHPPFLRSSNGGSTWDNISGSLPWHVIKIQVHPLTHNVYALTEGAGLYFSSDFGDHWEFKGNQFWLDFIIDKNNPQIFWGGNHTANQSSGGLFYSEDAGNSFELIGLKDQIINSLCLNGNSSTLYLSSYQTGIYSVK